MSIPVISLTPHAPPSPRLRPPNLNNTQNPQIFTKFSFRNPESAAKMSAQRISSHRENAEVYTGDAACKQKSTELLEKMNLPRGLLPLDDVVEVGYNEATGFVWLKQKKSKTHVFRQIGRSVWYDTEVTAFVQDRRMKKVTGVKSKEILIWVTITDISIQDSDPEKITFGTTTGLSRTFPASAFEVEEEKGTN